MTTIVVVTARVEARKVGVGDVGVVVPSVVPGLHPWRALHPASRHHHSSTSTDHQGGVEPQHHTGLRCSLRSSTRAAATAQHRKPSPGFGLREVDSGVEPQIEVEGRVEVWVALLLRSISAAVVAGIGRIWPAANRSPRGVARER